MFAATTTTIFFVHFKKFVLFYSTQRSSADSNLSAAVVAAVGDIKLGAVAVRAIAIDVSVSVAMAGLHYAPNAAREPVGQEERERGESARDHCCRRQLQLPLAQGRHTI